MQLAAAAADVFAGGGVGLFEAGTGMGKSLAYLLPAAFHSAAAGRRVVVSTKTKALQRQLAAHELPLVAEALPEGWRWALLMGRENYICRRRLDEAVAAEEDALPDRDRALALAYLVGRARRGEVDLSALPYRASRELPALADLARELRSSRATCLGRHCPKRRGCHWRLARSRAEAAHLVCVNHALLLTGRDTLPPFEDVVIDEAHLLYHEATEAFSDEVDARGRGPPARGPPRASAASGRSGSGCAPSRARRGRTRPMPSSRRRTPASAPPRSSPTWCGPSARRSTGLAEAARETDEDGRGGAATPRRRLRPHGLADGRAARAPGVGSRSPTAIGLLAEGLQALSAGVAPAAETLPEDHRDHAAAAALADEAAGAAALLSELPESGGADAVAWGAVEAAGREPWRPQCPSPAVSAAGRPRAGRSRARR